MTQVSNEINRGRTIAYETFRGTLSDLHGRTGVTELQFRDEWLARLSVHEELTVDGWYDPPPLGVAIFTGSDATETPFAFASLRSEPYWPSDRRIDWQRGIMYAYCSPVHLTDRLPADFGITLYFGRDPAVRAHFATALSLTREVMEGITSDTMARPLFRRSQTVFHNAGMRSNVASITDSVPVDLGHSLPLVDTMELGVGRQLTERARVALRTGRLFISESADWDLASVPQFTIEPSLISLHNPRLPQVSPHYVLSVSDMGVAICDECDALYAEFGLLA